MYGQKCRNNYIDIYDQEPEIFFPHIIAFYWDNIGKNEERRIVGETSFSYFTFKFFLY